MVGIVLELQRDALNSSVSLTDLLRKALVVARKLRLSDFQEWIESELGGYRGNLEPPPYREMVGQVKGWNPFHGWVPLIVNEPEIAEKIAKRRIAQSVSEIENLVAAESSRLMMPFPPGAQSLLQKWTNSDTEFALFVGASGLAGILDTVRNTVLNWALKLEEDGILGEGLAFSTSEKETAAQANYSVTNFFGDVSDSQIQQATGQNIKQQATAHLDLAAVRSLMDSVKKEIEDLELEESQADELASDIATIESQLESPKPKHGIIRESLKSIRNILEGASGGAMTHILVELGKLMI